MIPLADNSHRTYKWLLADLRISLTLLYSHVLSSPEYSFNFSVDIQINPWKKIDDLDS
jgi:hypothetical protein